MKVNLVIKESTKYSSFTLLGEVNYDELRETKTIEVRGSFLTKTRINTSLQTGQTRHGLNLEIDGFKTKSISEANYFSGGMSVKHYFKKLKSQGVERYKEYVIEAVKIALKDYIRIKLDEITINLILPNFN